MIKELKPVKKNKTWTIMTLPSGNKTVRCKWIYKIKYNSGGTIKRCKVRLVVKYYTQTYDIDYQEIFAPIEKMSFVRTLLYVLPIWNEIYPKWM
jgi:Reverse transcriptase (RNA-dependent DNA polymerase)